jgi:CHAD domain-containing protein
MRKVDIRSGSRPRSCYGTEFFASLYSDKKVKRHREFASALADIQDVLGNLNDVATGHELLKSLAMSEVDRPSYSRLG